MVKILPGCFVVNLSQNWSTSFWGCCFFILRRGAGSDGGGGGGGGDLSLSLAETEGALEGGRDDESRISKLDLELDMDTEGSGVWRRLSLLQ